MNDLLGLSPPLSFPAAADPDLFRLFRGQMHAAAADQVMVDARDAAGGPVTAPTPTPDQRPPLQTYLSYCSEFLDLGQYPKLAEQDRAVIADFISGELLQNIQWKYLFPHGAFECILSTTPGPETDDYACTEYTVFKINFETVSCSKDIRRVWTSKAKPKTADEPAAVDDAERNQSLELQSPIKPSLKRRTPTRRRSFEERDRRLTASTEPPPAKKTTKSTAKANTKKAEKTATAPAGEKATPKSGTAGKKATAKPATAGKKAQAAATVTATTPKKTTPRKTTPRKTTPKKAAEPVMVASVETYAVLTILDCKKKSGKYLYQVRWAGTDADGKPWDDTWEPAANISDDLLRDYWQRQQVKAAAAAAASDHDKVSVAHLLNSDPPAA